MLAHHLAPSARCFLCRALRVLRHVHMIVNNIALQSGGLDAFPLHYMSAPSTTNARCCCSRPAELCTFVLRAGILGFEGGGSGVARSSRPAVRAQQMVHVLFAQYGGDHRLGTA